MTKKIIGISIDECILTKLDGFRGLVPRSRIIQKIVEEKMGVENV